ncbi:MAG: class B sortase, partial [Oscillospiraceae bacterium]|nr:class B sortase [Oscillospiraceae bacterium]
MTIQLIGVGSQSRLRQVLQSNTDLLKDELGLLGIDTPAMPAVADTQQRLQHLLAETISSGHSAIIVGGIGEEDDFTVSTVCKGLSVPIVEDHLSYNQIKAKYEAEGQTAPKGVRRGVKVPEGATVFRSKTGGYPGCAVSSGGQCIIMLPDDPAELRSLLDGSVFSYLSEVSGRPAVRHRIGVSGLSASQASQMLEDLLGRKNPAVKVSAGAGEVLVRTTTLGQTLGEAANLGLSVVDAVKSRLGSCVYGVDTDGIVPVVSELLKSKNARIAVAEAGLEGQVCRLLSRGGILAGGADFSDNQGKKALGLNAKAQDDQTLAVAAANAIRRQSGAALGLAVHTESQPDGRQRISLALTDAKKAWTRTLSVNSSNPAFVRNVAVNQAMNMVRLYASHYNEILPTARELGEFQLASARGGKKAPAFAGVFGGKKEKAPEKTRGSQTPARREAAGEAAAQKAAWWTRFIPVKGDDKREIIRKCVFWLAIVVFISSIAYIIGVKQESVNNEKLTQELGSMLVDDDYEASDDYPDDYLKKFAALWERNEDIAGWIEIAGTQVNYPVVQGKNNEFYSRLDFDRNNNNHGVPFVDFRVDQKKPSTNTVIYAHNMNDGQMFGELMNYKNLSYYKEHPTFRYDSVYKENEYKILGVFLVTANDPEFLYHNMIDLDEAELTEFVNQVRARSLINTKIDVKTTDKLVTLSTCDYSFKDAQGNRVARFVVVGRAIRDGEAPAVDTSVATLNANPVMPAEWYEQIKRNQEAAELAAAESAAQEALDSVDPENISAWLTQEEIDAYLADGYTEDDLWYFADERRYELLEWLTEAEMTSLTAAEKLSAMYARRDKLWLAEEDHSLTEAEKREKIAANQAAAAILSPEELAKCRSWSEIQKAMKKKLESMCETTGCTLPRGHEGLHSNQSPCDTAGCTLPKGHEGLHSNQTPCDTAGCTLPKGH